MAIKRYEPDAALQSIPQTRPVVHRTMRFAAIAVFALAGCSSGTSHIGPSAPTSPQSWNVQTGVSSQNEALQGLAYYPSAPLTIDVGDTMTWSFPANEPHTVALLGAGQTNPPAPTDPSAAKPAGGSTYDGSTFTNSGFLAGGKSYSLTFTKAGTYKVYCLIHQPQMEATIVVNAAGTPYPQTQGISLARARALRLPTSPLRPRRSATIRSLGTRSISLPVSHRRRRAASRPHRPPCASSQRTISRRRRQPFPSAVRSRGRISPTTSCIP